MTHRPYPNPDRARHQLERHDDETPPLLWQPRPMSQFERQFFEASASAVRALAPQLQAIGESLRAGFASPRPVGSEEKTG